MPRRVHPERMSATDDRIQIALERISAVADHAQTLLAELKKANESTKISVATRQDHLDTSANGLEQEAANTLARELNGCVVRAGYKWALCFPGTPGDLDICVEAVVDGKASVILGECMGPLSNNEKLAVADAKLQLQLNVVRWNWLCTLAESGVTGDEPLPDDYDSDPELWSSQWRDSMYIKEHLKDVEALRVRELKDRPLVLALGGTHMPAEIINTHLDRSMKAFTLLRIDADAGKVSRVDIPP